MAAAGHRQGRLRDPHQGGLTSGGHLRSADAQRHRRGLLAPVRQARPDHPRLDRVRRVPARRSRAGRNLRARAQDLHAGRMGRARDARLRRL
jgi:hypothetical protein